MVRKAELIDIFVRQPTGDDQGGAAWQGWNPPESAFPEEIEGEFWPDRNHIFRALELISPENVRYLILGQDPYFVSTNPGHPNDVPAAIGIAFGVNNAFLPVPRSLLRIKQYIYPGGQGQSDLVEWATRHGVLLLNAALTVPRPLGNDGRRQARRHLKLWRDFTRNVIQQLRLANPNAVLTAWGCPARDRLSESLGVNGPTVPWFYHPVASIAGENSFAQFWAEFPELCHAE